MKPWLAITLLLAAIASPGRAEEDCQWNIRVELQAVAVPMAKAFPLMPALRDPAKFAAAEARVHALLASGEAELIDQTQALAGQGEKATAESLEDIRYRMELDSGGCLAFGPHYSPFAAAIAEARNGLPAGERKRNARWQKRQDDALAATMNQSFCANPTTPTAFDTRNTGTALEVEGQLDPASGQLSLSVFAQWVRFDGLEPTLAGRLGGTPYAIPQPRFTTFQAQAGLNLANGQGVLLGSTVLPQPQPRLLLFLLHATALPLPRTSP